MKDHKPHAYVAARATLGYGLPLANSTPDTLVPTVVIQEGWVLKKRRKKMQGFARRYFTLYQTGLLTYSFEPGQPVRDQITLQSAAISTAPGRKDIHIDSSNATFHIKCLSTEDFSRWMLAFSKFTALEAHKSASVRRPLRPDSVAINKTAGIIDEMAAALDALEEAFGEFADSNSKKHHTGVRGKSEKDKQRESASVFGIFKKAHHHEDSQQTDLPTSEQRVRTAIETLKRQHALLLKSFSSLSPLDSSTHSAYPSPLSTTEEGEEQAPGHGDPAKSSSSLPFIRNAKRASTATTITDSLNDSWYDASEGEGAEVFVLEEAASPDAGEPSRITTNTIDSQSDLDREETSSLDTDINEEEPTSAVEPSHNSQDVVRRTKLPSPVVGDEGSLFAVLKKNVGKDISTIALPVTFNEPLTLLQRAAEEMEYYELLNQAAKESDPTKRLQYVAAFAVSSYAHTRHRTGRKGFNPMLGETFEDTRMKFIAEKVRHNPVEMAYHAEGSDWELTSTSSGKTKFWGKSLEIIPLGTTYLRVGEDQYEWKKPSSFMRNLIVGTKYLEHVGNMVIHNTTNNTRCVLEFKPSSYWGASNLVEGTVQDSSGNTVSKLEGKWDEHVSHDMGSSTFVVLWRAAPWPKNSQDFYGFTSFSMTLNEITPDIEGKLPPTDSRLRTDVRALEQGNLDFAEAEKARIEEAQRERRRDGTDQNPRWFKQQGDEWVYRGGYWEERAKGWKGAQVRPLW